MNRKEWFFVVGDWNFECYQNIKNPEVYAVYDTHKKRHTITNDCVRDVEKHPEAYEWI